MRPFRRARRGYVAELSAAERLVLAHVVGDVVELLQGQTGAASREVSGMQHIEGVAPLVAPGDDVRAPTDPAVRRLLPDASREDDGVSTEFRRLTQADLAAEKSQRLLLSRTCCSRATRRTRRRTRPRGPARRRAPRRGALTDIRVVLADRLDLRTDEQVEDLHDEVMEREDADVEPEDEGALTRPGGSSRACSSCPDGSRSRWSS
ncbi:DUF2017 family protein [Oerskovia sp. M15]